MYSAFTTEGGSPGEGGAVGEQDNAPLSHSFPGLFHVWAHVRALSCCQGLIEQKEESKENHHYRQGQGRKGWQL